jgi:hypothetical protein
MKTHKQSTNSRCGMPYMRLAEDFIGKMVSVVRTQAPPMRGELIETSSDGIKD